MASYKEKYKELLQDFRVVKETLRKLDFQVSEMKIFINAKQSQVNTLETINKSLYELIAHISVIKTKKPMMTKNCIVCGKEAKVWTGHVLKGTEKVAAGWCKPHLQLSEDINLMQGSACFGELKPEHGLRPEFEL